MYFMLHLQGVLQLMLTGRATGEMAMVGVQRLLKM